jgi:hypothetical protein
MISLSVWRKLQPTTVEKKKHKESKNKIEEATLHYVQGDTHQASGARIGNLHHQILNNWAGILKDAIVSKPPKAPQSGQDEAIQNWVTKHYNQLFLVYQLVTSWRCLILSLPE